MVVKQIGKPYHAQLRHELDHNDLTVTIQSSLTMIRFMSYWTNSPEAKEISEMSSDQLGKILHQQPPQTEHPNRLIRAMINIQVMGHNIINVNVNRFRVTCYIEQSTPIPHRLSMQEHEYQAKQTQRNQEVLQIRTLPEIDVVDNSSFVEEYYCPVQYDPVKDPGPKIEVKFDPEGPFCKPESLPNQVVMNMVSGTCAENVKLDRDRNCGNVIFVVWDNVTYIEEYGFHDEFKKRFGGLPRELVPIPYFPRDGKHGMGVMSAIGGNKIGLCDRSVLYTAFYEVDDIEVLEAIGNLAKEAKKQNRVVIVNGSWGKYFTIFSLATEPDQVAQTIVNENDNLMLIFASGNHKANHCNATLFEHPLDGVTKRFPPQRTEDDTYIYIAASEPDNNRLVYYSNYGPCVKYTAPTDYCIFTADTSDPTTGLYLRYRGTSFSSPLFASLVGSIWSNHTSLTRSEILSLVDKQTVKVKGQDPQLVSDSQKRPPIDGESQEFDSNKAFLTPILQDVANCLGYNEEKRKRRKNALLIGGIVATIGIFFLIFGYINRRWILRKLGIIQGNESSSESGLSSDNNEGGLDDDEEKDYDPDEYVTMPKPGEFD